MQVERDLCTKEGVRGYPTIKYWKGGEGDGTKYQVRPVLYCRTTPHSTAQHSTVLTAARSLSRVLERERARVAAPADSYACWQGGRDFNALKKFVESTLL